MKGEVGVDKPMKQKGKKFQEKTSEGKRSEHSITEKKQEI